MLSLYVEDNTFNQDVMKKILQHMGHQVMIASRGEEALNMAQKFHPDVIFMDYHLPGMTGIEVTRQLRTIPTFAQTPIIALTADIFAREEFLAAGCQHFISKPISRSSIQRVLDEVDRQ
jgi:CheY-like chemotaxis protein